MNQPLGFDSMNPHVNHLITIQPISLGTCVEFNQLVGVKKLDIVQMKLKLLTI